MPTALISVSDKKGVEEFARGLVELGWDIVSTGGTAKALRDAGLQVTDVSELTGQAEILGGRVKTLHPAVHAGILAQREEAEDMKTLGLSRYREIDLVAVNLYPFHEAAAAGLPLAEAMHEVDIGGPTMLRAAAKNHAYVFVVVDPADYPRVLDMIRDAGNDMKVRRDLARKVFDHTARYDRAIADYFEKHTKKPEGELLPPTLTLQLQRAQALRYGENPDQAAAYYVERGKPGITQLHGKELSFNNILDVDASVMTVSAWADSPTAACVIVKHTTPCGIALAASVETAYERALACDPTSAFGGIVAVNRPVNAKLAEALNAIFLEIVVAPSFDPDAFSVLQSKKNLRLIEMPITVADARDLDYKRVRGGLLVQARMHMVFDEGPWKTVSERAPSADELVDLRFAWRACAAVKSNAIVLAREQRTLGIGAGQMSRVDSSRLAVMKAHDQGFSLEGAVLASDAFFPFRDGVDAAAAAGVKAVIQPGGSLRDEEVIQAANDHGIAMIFTGRRVFRH